MQQTMRSLLQTTETLKGVIENALTQQPPSKSQGRPNGESQLLSPISSNEGPVQDTQDTQDYDGDTV